MADDFWSMSLVGKIGTIVLGIGALTLLSSVLNLVELEFRGMDLFDGLFLYDPTIKWVVGVVFTVVGFGVLWYNGDLDPDED